MKRSCCISLVILWMLLSVDAQITTELSTDMDDSVTGPAKESPVTTTVPVVRNKTVASTVRPKPTIATTITSPPTTKRSLATSPRTTLAAFQQSDPDRPKEEIRSDTHVLKSKQQPKVNRTKTSEAGNVPDDIARWEHWRTMALFSSPHEMSKMKFFKPRVHAQARQAGGAGTGGGDEGLTGDCTFGNGGELSICDWIQVTTTALHWNTGSGATAYMLGGPTNDHSGTPEGGYAFVDTSMGGLGSGMEQQRALLQSAPLNRTGPEGRCFQFWYNMGGLSSDRLRVLLQPVDDTRAIQARLPRLSLLWERRDTTNETWMLAEVLYTMNLEHKIFFEAVSKPGSDPTRMYRGHVAIDDIGIDGPSSCLGFCTFEGGLCGWQNSDADDDFEWSQGRGSLSRLTGPARDHGEGVGGGYIYMDTSFPRRPGDVARLYSPTLESTSTTPICFKFWIHMFGNGIGTLRVLLSSETGEKVVWEVTGESGNAWHMGQVTVASPTSFRIILEGIAGRNALGDIAVDDVSFVPGPCPCSPQSALPARGDCTFEADECGWINAGTGDQFDWARVSSAQAVSAITKATMNNAGSGPAPAPAPSRPGAPPPPPPPPPVSAQQNLAFRIPDLMADHTSGLASGYYLTMERSNVPPRSGDQAYIISPVIEGSEGGSCFSFWAYMQERSVDAAGPGLGSLTVYVRVATVAALTPIWKLTNYHSPNWFYAQASILEKERHQIALAGTWGSSRQGTIAVDDFAFFDGPCSVTPSEAEVISGECSFDTSLCEWQPLLVNSSDSDPLQASGNIIAGSISHQTWQLASPMRRPANLDDHTYRSSTGYAFFDIFSQTSSMVRLESPVMEPAGTEQQFQCLSFWFAPFGSSRTTTLSVIQKDADADIENQVWKVQTSNFQVFRPDWIYGQVGLTADKPFKIIFEGISNNGGFAVDDVTFLPTPCSTRPTLTDTQLNFRYWNRRSPQPAHYWQRP